MSQKNTVVGFRCGQVVAPESLQKFIGTTQKVVYVDASDCQNHRKEWYIKYGH
jgi:hypothetical protein